MPVMSKSLVAVDAEVPGVLAFAELAGEDPHPDEVDRWMRSKLWATTALTPRSFVPLAAQSRELPDAVLLAREDQQRHAVGLVPHRRVVDRHQFAVGLVHGHAAFDARHHEVLDPDVGEGAARHDAVVAAAGAVAVEVLGLDAVLLKVEPGGGVGLIAPAGLM